MSLENVTLDFGHLSFDNKSNMPTPHYNSAQPGASSSIKVAKDSKRGNRNRKCVPSDDEEEEDEDDGEESLSSEDEYSGLPRGKSSLRSNTVITSAITTPTKPIRKSKPLPSDDEDSKDEDEDEEEDEEDDNKLLGSKVPQIGRTSPDPNSRSGLHKQHSQEDVYHAGDMNRDYINYYDNNNNNHNSIYNNYNGDNNADNEDDDDDRALMNPNIIRGSPHNTPPILTLPEGSHLQQLQQMQQYHQSQLAQFQYHQMQQQQQPIPSKSSSSHLRPSSPNTQRISMSGMDLLKQLEQEKADAKRLKPKLDTSQVKIEGLLGRLPEPGSHNISFQQIQQQQQQQQQLLHQQQQQQLQFQQQFQQQAYYNHQYSLNTSKSKQRMTVAPGYLDPYYQQYPPRSPSPSGTKHRQQGSRGSNLY